MTESFRKKVRPPKPPKGPPPPPPLFQLLKPPAGSPVLDPLQRFLGKSGTDEMDKMIKKLTESSGDKKDA